MKLPVWAALALSAAGCSLIIPLDYTGGVGGSAGTGGAGASNGGSSGVGNAAQGGTAQGAEAGVGNEGGNPQGGAGFEGGTGGATSPGGTDSGGRGGTSGGTDGGASGTGGVGGSSMGGEDAGGEAGAGPAGTSGGGVGGTGGSSGRGGTAGGGMAGTAGCSFDLTSNPMHCGSCTNACPSGNDCIDSECVASPCDKLGCGSIQMAANSGGGMRKDSVGTTNDVCVEVQSYTPNTGYAPAINCWNTDSRTAKVNEVTVTCGSDQPLTMPRRKGGYCVHFGPGQKPEAGFVLPFTPSGCCNGSGMGTCCSTNGGTGGT
ncbi:MAG TPA: hypothetical protein VFV94_07190 [Polyangiaceae bacterium]|nr:hypothetical protein [Polyangiaceae bacterium]